MRKAILIIAAVVILAGLSLAGAAYWFFSGDGVRLTLEQQASAYLGQPVKIGGAGAHVFPRAAISLTDVRIGDPVRLTLANVQLATDLRALFSRRIEDATVVISNSRIEMPLPELPTGGESSGETAGAAPAGGSSGVKIVSVKEIRIRDVSIESRGREIVISADSALEGDQLALRDFSATSGQTSLHVTGDIALEPRIDATLKATANKLDLDELLALANAFTPERAASSKSSRSQPMKVVAQISANSALMGGVEVSKLTGAMTMDGDRVSLSPLTFGLFDGHYEGSINARLGNSLSVRWQSKLQGINVAKLAEFGGSPNTVTGTLSGTGTFSAQGADMAAILANASGKGNASIVDGTIRGLNLVRTAILFFGKPAPDAGASSDHFDTFDASFSLAQQVFRADSIAMHSADADVTGSGSLTLADQALAGSLNMLLSEDLSAQAGTDLVRYAHEGNRVVLPARIGGTLSEPRVTIDASAAIKRGLTNEIERRFKGLFGR